MFFVLIFAVFFGLHIFTCSVFYYFFPGIFTKFLLWVMPAGGTALIMLGFALSRRGGGAFENIISAAGHYWQGILFIIFSVAAAMAVGEVLCGLLVRVKVVPAPLTWWIGRFGLVFAGVFVLLGIMGGQAAPMVKKINLKSAKLPVDKLSIVQISDTHLGAGVRFARVKAMAEQINALEPDLVLVTGDFFENGDAERGPTAALLRGLKTKYGVYGSLGNHEFYRGLQNSTDFYKEAGVKLLRQETARPLPGIAVSGVDDFNTAHIKNKDFAAFLDTLNPREYNIVMAHEPKYYTAAKGRLDLMLSGHTHAGQIWPFRYLVKTRYPHVYGLKTMGGSNFYVSSGVFYWGPPVRLFSRNEIVYITVEKE